MLPASRSPTLSDPRSEMSAETDALIAYLEATGVPHVVTATTGRYVSPEDPCSPHSDFSYHCAAATPSPADPDGRGLAIDADGPNLDAVYAALAPLGPVCAELIHGAKQWRNGRRVPQYDFAPNTLTHVHIAVPRGVIVSHPGGESPMPEPLHPLVGIAAAPDGDGYWLVAADGAVYAFGSAAYAGRLVVDGAGNWQVAP